MNLNRPPAVRLPDAALWEKRHGLKPWDITDPRMEKYVPFALALEQEDWSTLEAQDAFDIQAELEGICTGVAGLLGLLEEVLVAFDPVRRVFVAFPYPEALNDVQKTAP